MPHAERRKVVARQTGPRKGDPKAQYVATVPEDSSTDDFLLHIVCAKQFCPMTVDLLVDGKQFAMEVDTDTAISIISEATYKSLLTKLQKCNVVLSTYTDEHMTILGHFSVQITYGQQHKQQLLLSSLPPNVAPMSQDS